MMQWKKKHQFPGCLGYDGYAGFLYFRMGSERTPGKEKCREKGFFYPKHDGLSVNKKTNAYGEL